MDSVHTNLCKKTTPLALKRGKTELELTLKVRIETLNKTMERIDDELDSGYYHGPGYAFGSLELMLETFARGRLGVVKALMGEKPMSLRELARRLGRDVHAVHTDVHALLGNGFIDKCENGKLSFPYDAIHFDFVLSGVAA